MSLLDPNKTSIQIPRWVVYCQAALLGVVATTFFIFGMMVSSVTNLDTQKQNNEEFRVTGIVVYADEKADAGAVVLLLPDPPGGINRQDPSTITPFNFEPLENPTIDWIREQGGTVVRSNINGAFEIFARPGNYVLVVISTKQAQEPQQLTKKQIAGLSQYFLPVEKLINRNLFWWETIQLNGDYEIGTIRCQVSVEN